MSRRRIMLPMLVALVGAGLGMWAMATPAHGTVIEPLTVTKMTTNNDHQGPADDHVLPGGTVYYQIMIGNPNGFPVDLTSITDTLPPGFTYDTESTSGLVGVDPDVSGQILTWTFDGTSVDAESTGVLNFSATASESIGMYCNNASVDWGTGVGSTGPTAAVQVLNEGQDQATPTCAEPTVVRMRTHTPTATVTAPATATPVPSTATATPVPATATQPSGGSAGAIAAPNTGTGSSASAGGPSAMLLVVAALLVVGGLGAAAAGVIRR